MRIAVLGTFGAGNLGDESLFIAFRENFSASHPQGKLTAICNKPEYMRETHGIESVTLRPAGKIKSWLHARKISQDHDALIILGGGQIHDFWDGPLGHPWNLFSWTKAFHRACKPVFIPSIGAFPLRHTLSSILIRSTLKTAKYVSFRDADSKRIAQQLGFRNHCAILPDLAFSLQSASEPSPQATGWVGLTPMVYMHPELWPSGDAALYQGYIRTVAEFGKTILEQHFKIRVFASQIRSDKRAIEDLLAELDPDGSKRQQGKIELPVVRDVPTFLQAMASVETVVATRFHGVLLGLLTGIRVISIGYQIKNDQLMAAFGQASASLDFHAFTSEDLARAFEYTKHIPFAAKQKHQEALQLSRRQLEQQYQTLFNGVKSPKPVHS